MSPRGSVFALLLLIGSIATGCAATRVESIAIPQDRLASFPGSEPVAVTARSLRPGPRKVEIMNFVMEVDEGDYARMLETAIEEELKRQGHPISESAMRKLDLTIIHVALLGGVSTTCFVEFVALKPGGAEKGFQAKGGSGDPVEACERALAEAAVMVLNDVDVQRALGRGEQATTVSMR